MVARNHCLMKLRDKNVFITIEDNTQLPANETDRKELAEKGFEVILNKTYDGALFEIIKN